MITLPFKPIGVAVTLSAGLVAGLGLHYLTPYAHSRATAFEQSGDQSRDADQALIDYHYASLLWPGNISIADKLSAQYVQHQQPDEAINVYMRLKHSDGYPKAAMLQIKYHQPDQALALMNKLLDDKSDPTWLKLKSMALLELGRTADASDAAEQAGTYSLGNADLAVLHGMILAIQGDNEGLSHYMATLDVPEAADTLARIAASKLALAQELYATGLPESSQRILNDNRQPTNAEYGKLTAAIALQSTSKSYWQSASDILKQSLAANPADNDLRQSYRQILIKLGDHSAADAQDKAIQAQAAVR